MLFSLPTSINLARQPRRARYQLVGTAHGGQSSETRAIRGLKGSE
ncbi:hypothetical protein [Pantoea alhagi]|nr:hypothetical protein [Pantoea alhagi]